MTLNSLTFLIFFPLVLAAQAFAGKWRWLILLIASYVFYLTMLSPALALVLPLITLGTWLIGQRLEAAAEKIRIRWLTLGVGLILSTLIYFKYLAFWTNSLLELLASRGIQLEFSAPPALRIIGLSYFVFQAISYLADIYFKTGKAEPHLGKFALFLAFFPKLIQGPIERAETLLPQLKKIFVYDHAAARLGLLLFTWGLFKKTVAADRLGLFVDTAFGDVAAHTGPDLLIASYYFMAQLFCDFSGYTDMALGCALLLGVRLTQNFNGPYAADSMTDFWRRWHITLSEWIRDYVFEPLQMRFRYWGITGAALALFIAFFLMGVWHDATWGYAAFGLMHGIYMAVPILTKAPLKKFRKKFGRKTPFIPKPFRILIVFHLVGFSFMLFRSPSVSAAWTISKKIWNEAILQPATWNLQAWTLGQKTQELWIAAAAVLTVCLVYPLRQRFSLSTMPGWARWVLYSSLVFSLLMLGKFFQDKQFIYSQF